jgi:hypothetical protein
MAFVVEDGTGLAEANAYIDVAYADAYFADRGIAAWTGDASAKEQAIVRATDYVDTVWGSRFRGGKSSQEQPLEWPRSAFDGLPAALVKATAEYAVRALSTTLLPDPEVSASGAMVIETSSKVGPIEESFKYSEAAGIDLIKPYPAADNLLLTLCRTRGTVIRN